MKGQEDVYREPVIITYPNMTVSVYRPILTAEERSRRMKEIEKAVGAMFAKERKR